LVGQIENNPGSSAWNGVGNGSQTSLVVLPGGGYVFEPVFNPGTTTWTTDPLANNHRSAFTFWRTDYLDRSWKNSGLGTSNVNGTAPALGAIGGVVGATGYVEVGTDDPFPSGLYSSFPGNNTFSLMSDANESTSLHLTGGFNVAGLVDSFDNTSPMIPITQAPLNSYNGYGMAPSAQQSGIYPGNKGGN
jgi:hypothetical protein